ncbi:MAG: CHASE2 domain-containing protein [Cyanobacteria bacterium J06642_11]
MKFSWSSLPSPWRMRLLPGFSITGLIILARILGWLQPLEWKALDLSLRLRPAETIDPRITLVTITDEDLQSTLDYPISDQDLSELLTTLQTYSPRVVGLDLFRDKPVGQGYDALKNTLETADNVIGIYKVDPSNPVPASPILSEDQVGFADAILDNDGFLRRSLLGQADADGDYRFSLTIQLVSRYLATEGLQLENGIRDPETMRFGTTEIPRFQAHTGGYVRADRGGNQTLINFRAGKTPFEKITYSDLMAGQGIDPVLRDRIVLVGYTAASVKDFVSSGAVAGVSPSLVPGMDVQAHAVSQLVSAVLDGRPFLRWLPEGVEYLLIVVGSLGGLALAQWGRKPLVHFLIVATVGGVAVILSHGLVMVSWWLPLVPVGMAFGINAALLYPFYQAQRHLRSQLEDRQQLINQTYDTIHNGPLQSLAEILRNWPPEEIETLHGDLEQLNKELRNINYAVSEKVIVSPTKQMMLVGGQRVDLQSPLDELLQEVYRITLERHRDFFEPMLKVVAFETMDDAQISLAQKQDLGRFLEEALKNVYKYAKSTTCLIVDCRQQDGYNSIQVRDNGDGLKPSQPNAFGGHGTRQAQRLARSLNGTFERAATNPKGVCCQLRWPVQQPRWQRWLP